MPVARLPGCHCPECFGLAEFMLETTGDPHGLPLARGHALLPVERADPPEPVVLEPRRAAAQPWEPRAPRNRARLQGERPAA